MCTFATCALMITPFISPPTASSYTFLVTALAQTISLVGAIVDGAVPLHMCAMTVGSFLNSVESDRLSVYRKPGELLSSHAAAIFR